MFEALSQVLEAVRGGFGRKRVLVVGDVMLDRYIWGDVSRISPEAPVPVVRVTRTSETPGGAGNVALNVAGLGLRVSLAGIPGEDADRARLAALLQEHGIGTHALIAAGGRA